MSTLHPYQDRKRLKWMGFFLSEHTATLAGLEKEENYVVEPKPQMSAKEINELLTEAQLKSKSIMLQTNEVIDDKHLPDIVGRVTGYDDLGIYVDSKLVEYENIRNVGFHEEKKWFDLE